MWFVDDFFFFLMWWNLIDFLFVNVRFEKFFFNSLWEFEMNFWNLVVFGLEGEEWGELRKMGEFGEREDLEEYGVKGEDWEEVELKVCSLVVGF